jgi:hypothetical protein
MGSSHLVLFILRPIRDKNRYKSTIKTMTHSLSLISKHYSIYCRNNTNVKQHDVLFDQTAHSLQYAREVLNALGVMNGPSHGEFIMTDDGPCMVEMNVRCHGGDAIWQPLCRGLTGGYNQVDGTVAAYLDPEQFWSFPDAPGPFQTFGQCVELVSFSEGIVKSMPGFRRIEDLASFVALETGHHMGSQVRKTVDMATEAGTVVVMNTDKRALAFDIEVIRALEKANALFEYESRGSHSGAAFPSTDMLERKMSVPREPETIMVDDFMAPSMYLERKLSMPKDEEAMFCTRN